MPGKDERRSHQEKLSDAGNDCGGCMETLEKANSIRNNEQNSATESNSSNSRRTILQGIAASIGGLELTNVFGKARAAESTKIAYAKKGDEVVVWKKVPKPWYQHSQKVNRITDQIRAQYMPKKGVKTVGKVTSSEKFAGKQGFQVRAEIHPNEFKGKIPSSVEGVPVSVKETKQPPSYGSCGTTTSDNPDNIASGTTVERDSDCRTSFGSLGAPVEYNNVTGMLTAAHIWGDCPSGVGGNPAYHDSDYFGEVHTWNSDEDWLVIEGNSTESVSGDIWDPDNQERVPINGYVTSDGIDDLNSSNETIFKVGVTSGKENGFVDGNRISSGWDCVDFNGYGVECEIPFADGDSGGPVYETRTFNNDKYAYMITISQHQPCCYTGSISCHPTCPNVDLDVYDTLRGTGWYHITNNHPVSLNI